MQQFIQHVIEEHSAVIFNGDGYSEIWHKEAARRGLPDLRTTPDALPVLSSPEVVELYTSQGVLDKTELKARQEIYLEQYCKTLRTEANLVVRMARTIIFPAGMRYQGELAATCANFKTIGKEFRTTTLDEVTERLRNLQEAVLRLEAQLEATTGIHDDTLALARHYCDKVIPCMKDVRAWADALEIVVADDLWALPSYQEILFGK